MHYRSPHLEIFRTLGWSRFSACCCTGLVALALSNCSSDNSNTPSSGGTSGASGAGGRAGTPSGGAGTSATGGVGGVGGNSAGGSGSGGAGAGGESSGGSGGGGNSAGGAAGTGSGGAPPVPDLVVGQASIYVPKTLRDVGGKKVLQLCVQPADRTDGFIKFENRGTAPISGFEYQYGVVNPEKKDPVGCTESVTANIDPGQTYELKPTTETCCPLDRPAGTYYFFISADPNNKLVESNELNNWAYGNNTFEVTASYAGGSQPLKVELRER